MKNREQAKKAIKRKLPSFFVTNELVFSPKWSSFNLSSDDRSMLG
jgi:hypothetical protein